MTLPDTPTRTALRAEVDAQIEVLDGRIDDLESGGGEHTHPTADIVAFSAAVDARAQLLIDALVGAAPGALDTLVELAAALGNDADFAAATTTALAGKQPLHATLTALAALTLADGTVLTRQGGAFSLQTYAALKTALALATVATTGAYADLSGTPAIPDSPDDVGAAPLVHTHTKSDVGLASVDNTSDALKPISTAQQAALDLKAALTVTDALDIRVDALESAGGGGASFEIVDARITSGDFTPPNTLGAWAKPGDALGLANSFRLTLPNCQVGDWVEIGLRGMRNDTTSAQFDFAVQVGSSIVRYLSSGTSSPSVEGDPAMYPNTGFRPHASVPAGFVVTPGDLDGTQIRFVLANKSAGAGTFYASANYPFWWVAKRWRQ